MRAGSSRADAFAGLRAAFDADRAARYTGQAPGMIQVAYEKVPGEMAALPTEDTPRLLLRADPGPGAGLAQRGDAALGRDSSSTNPVPIAGISPTPLMMMVAAKDHLTVADLRLEHHERAREPKKLLVLPVPHFDAYVRDAFAVSAPAQLDWFRTHLG